MVDKSEFGKKTDYCQDCDCGYSQVCSQDVFLCASSNTAFKKDLMASTSLLINTSHNESKTADKDLHCSDII